jgi:hypothetical protein
VCSSKCKKYFSFSRSRQTREATYLYFHLLHPNLREFGLLAVDWVVSLYILRYDVMTTTTRFTIHLHPAVKFSMGTLNNKY